jgi:hypothetical protein
MSKVKWCFLGSRHRVELVLKQLKTKNLRVKKLMNCFGNSASAYFEVLDSFVR